MVLDEGVAAAVVGELRRARRKQRVAAIHWVDALYQVYITGLLAVVAVVFASGLVGDTEVSAATLVDVQSHGAAVVGVVAALAVFLGLRSGLLPHCGPGSVLHGPPAAATAPHHLAGARASL